VALAGQGYAAEALAAALAWSAGTGPEWVSSREHRRRRRAGAALFLALARPEILADRSLDPRPGWRAALDAAPYEPEPTFAEAAWQWLDACLDARRTRRRVVSILVDAARPAPAPPVIAYRTDPAGPTRAHVMIATARRWAEEDRADPVRRRVMEEIVVPLTRPWLLRWALILAVALRARFGESAAD